MRGQISATAQRVPGPALRTLPEPLCPGRGSESLGSQHPVSFDGRRSLRVPDLCPAEGFHFSSQPLRRPLACTPSLPRSQSGGSQVSHVYTGGPWAAIPSLMLPCSAGSSGPFGVRTGITEGTARTRCGQWGSWGFS